MKIRTLFQTLPAVLCLQTAAAQSPRQAPVHIGLVYPISSNGAQARSYSNAFSLHAIAGVSGSERAAAIAGIGNIVYDSAAGVQIAGIINYNRGSARGLQCAGFINTARRINGAQIAGFMNSAQRTEGIQTAGFLNTAQQAGTQVAGFANVAGDVRGTQIAGFLNIAHKVRGAQIGFLNIADSSDCPVGIINIIRHGERAIGLTVDETATSLIAFRSGGRRLYGIIGAGVNLQEPEPGRRTLYALEGGIGCQLPVYGHFRVKAEGAVLALSDFRRGAYLRSSARILPALRIGQAELFGGLSFNCVNSSRNTGRHLVSDYTWKHSNRYGDFTGLYFGGMAGIQLLL